MRGSQSPCAFFHERFVATENTVNCDPRLPVLVFCVCADEADESESVEIHAFLLFCPCVLGHPEASGHRSQGKELLFWGGPEWGGSLNLKGDIVEAEAPQTPGRGNWPEAVPRTKGQNRRNHCFCRDRIGNIEKRADPELGMRETRTSTCSDK